MRSYDDETLIALLRQSMPRPLAGMQIDGASHLKDDLGIDSLGLITFTMLLQDAFGIEVGDRVAELAAAQTVDALGALVSGWCALEASA
jgi:acyl carrier protein